MEKWNENRGRRFNVQLYFLAIKPPNERTIYGAVVMDFLLVMGVYCVS